MIPMLLSTSSIFVLSIIITEKNKLIGYENYKHWYPGEGENTSLFDYSRSFNFFMKEGSRDLWGLMFFTSFFWFWTKIQNFSVLFDFRGIMYFFLPIMIFMLNYHEEIEIAGIAIMVPLFFVLPSIFIGWKSKNKLFSRSFYNTMHTEPQQSLWPNSIDYNVVSLLTVQDRISYDFIFNLVIWNFMGSVVAPLKNWSTMLPIYDNIFEIGCVMTTHCMDFHPKDGAGGLVAFGFILLSVLETAYAVYCAWEKKRPIFDFVHIAQVMLSAFVVKHGSPLLLIVLSYGSLIFSIFYPCFKCIQCCIN
jgi:hypothetical protein